jgi:hypothetical protein
MNRLFYLPKDNRNCVATEEIKKSFGNEIIADETFECQYEFVVIC